MMITTTRLPAPAPTPTLAPTALAASLQDPLVRVLDRLERALEAAGLHVWRYAPSPTEIRVIVATRLTVTIRRVDDLCPDLPRIAVTYRLGGRSFHHEGGWHDPIRFLDFAAVAAAIGREVRGA